MCCNRLAKTRTNHWPMPTIKAQLFHHTLGKTPAIENYYVRCIGRLHCIVKMKYIVLYIHTKVWQKIMRALRKPIRRLHFWHALLSSMDCSIRYLFCEFILLNISWNSSLSSYEGVILGGTIVDFLERTFFEHWWFFKKKITILLPRTAYIQRLN